MPTLILDTKQYNDSAAFC